MGHWHAKAVERAQGLVSAVMDLDGEAARRLSTYHRYAESFTDLEQMLSLKNLSVLHICTPGSTHYEIAQSAIDAGVNLIIEKPITSTAAETECLLNRAAEGGLLVCPVHQFMFQEGVLKARELLPQIDRIFHMEGTFCSAGGAGLDPQQVDRIVAEILPHPLSLMQLFLPSDLPEEKWVTMQPQQGEFRALCETSGITLSIFISMNARPTVCSFLIAGTRGTIHLDLFHGYTFMEPGQVSRMRKACHPFALASRQVSAAAINLGRRLIHWEPAYPGLRRLVSSFYEALENGGKSPISNDDTVLIARVRDHLIQTPRPGDISRCARPGMR